MQHTKNIGLMILIGVLGLFLGWLIWGRAHTQAAPQAMNSMTHTMPDGTTMESGDMHSMMTDMNAALKGKTGDVFDQEFINEMIVHHQGAIDMANLALTNAKHQEIKDLANAIISAQTKEISQMKQWQASWYGTGR